MSTLSFAEACAIMYPAKIAARNDQYRIGWLKSRLAPNVDDDALCYIQGMDGGHLTVGEAVRHLAALPVDISRFSIVVIRED